MQASAHPHSAIPMVVILCTLAMVAEGFDTYSIGFVVPIVIRQWAATPFAIGILLGGGVILSAIGTMAIGPLADRYGRKPCLVGALLVFGVMTIATGLPRDIVTLAIVRSISSLALGASVPVAVACASEAVAPDRRATVAAMMSASIAVGIVLSSLSAAAIVTSLGWPALMVLGGSYAIVLAAVIAVMLRETPASPSMAASPGAARDGLLSHTQVGRLALATGVLTAIFLVSFFINYWLPTVLINNGASVREAALISALAQSTSLLGAFGTGRAMDRYGPRALAVIYVFAAMALVVAMIRHDGLTLTAASLCLLCLLTNAAFGGAMALPVYLFPPELRASAVGLSVGAARLLGGTMGPIIGGRIIGSHLPQWTLGVAFAPPLILAALALICFRAPKVSL